MKNNQFDLTPERIERDVNFSKKLLRELCKVEYDECLARLCVGFPRLDVRWQSLKQKISDADVSEIERRWASLDNERMLRYERDYREGKIEIPKLPTFGLSNIDNLDHEVEQEKELVNDGDLTRDISSQTSIDKTSDMTEMIAGDNVAHAVESYLSVADTTEKGIKEVLVTGIKSGAISTDFPLYNAYIQTAIRRPRLDIDHITENAVIYRNICRIRDGNTDLVDKVIAHKNTKLAATESYSRALSVWKTSQQAFEEEFQAKEEVARTEDEQKMFEKGAGDITVGLTVSLTSPMVMGILEC